MQFDRNSKADNGLKVDSKNRQCQTKGPENVAEVRPRKRKRELRETGADKRSRAMGSPPTCQSELLEQRENNGNQEKSANKGNIEWRLGSTISGIENAKRSADFANLRCRLMFSCESSKPLRKLIRRRSKPKKMYRNSFKRNN